MRIAFALLALVALVALPSAPAFHGDDLPFVASFAGEGDGWIAVRLEADGFYVFEMVATHDGSSTADGIAWQHGDGWVTLTSYGSRGCGLDFVVDAEAAEHEVAHRLPYPCEGGIGGWGSGGHRNATLIGWVAGDIASWRFEVRGAARVVGVEQGEAIDLRASDFDRVASAQVETGWAGARAGTSGVHELAVEGLLFGLFHGDDTERSSAATPEGPRECGCRFAGSPAGTYTLFTDGAAASQGPLFAGADVRLPP